MDAVKTLLELKKDDLKRIKKRPAINVFRDNMSLGAILEKAYIEPKYHLKKNDKDCVGINHIYKEYSDRNIVFVGEGGVGKTTSFLRLYLGEYEDGQKKYDKEFYYCFAPDLLGSKRSLNNYQKKIREIIDNNLELDGILLMDGLEEAFLSKSKQVGEFLNKLDKCSFTIWVSCRTNFFKIIADDSVGIFEEIIDVKKWDKYDYETFISLCLADNANKDVIEERIKKINNNNHELLCRPLFATMILFIAENDNLDDVYNEYELIDIFIKKWIERDKKDNKSKRKPLKNDFKKLREIALKVYLKDRDRPLYSNSLSLYRDLFVMTNNNQGTIHGFIHREFLIYFIVNALIDAATKNTKEIIKWYSQTFYDDITNVIKPKLMRLNTEDIEKIYSNLFKEYKDTYDNKERIAKDFQRIDINPDDNTFLRLRDEILYFIFRLPHIKHNEFAEYAYNQYLRDNPKETMLFLGIAYGMAISNPNNYYTFEFAKRLTPGSDEEIRNRGWGMCFFGDVDEDGYTYEDKEGKPWNKVRENRFKRLLDDEKRYVTRILDLPLLYCYYSSRNFKDCNSYRDYSIIYNTNIELGYFGEEQKIFLRKIKNQLVDVYLKCLLRREIYKNYNVENFDIVEDMGLDTEKITIEIDKNVAERMLKQSQYTEDVKTNLKTFYYNKGKVIINEYSNLLSLPKRNNITYEEFEKRLKECKVVVISANSVEGTIISRRMCNGEELLDSYPCEGHLFQFATIEEISVCHIWPTDTSSFTQYGSFSALNIALDKASPCYVMSVGVAFGTDPNNQLLGDVLLSKELVFYDHFNKVTNGQVFFNPHETYRIDPNLNAQLHSLEIETPPTEVGDFKWYYGCMISGGTVLSDAVELAKLKEAANNIGYNVIGGEMEASGIYYACQKRNSHKIPFIIIKGICDWGAVKNGWEEITDNDAFGKSNDLIKNCVQAYACDNAFNTLRFVLKQLNYQLNTQDLSQNIELNSKETIKKNIQMLLFENHQILDQYGPNSISAIKNPASSSSLLKWEEEKINRIIPNNKKIIEEMEKNLSIFSKEEKEIYIKFKVHAEAFEARQLGRLEAKDVPQFPKEFEEMINAED